MFVISSVFDIVYSGGLFNLNLYYNGACIKSYDNTDRSNYKARR